MTGNQVVSTMFDFNTCNHMVRFVLRDDRNEHPGPYLGFNGVFIFVLTHRSTLYVSWICPNLSHFRAYIHNVFLVAMLIHNDMDP
jgi:hypothetical protein